MVYSSHARLLDRAAFFHPSMSLVTDIKALFEAGAHYGYPRARRHPTASSFLFGTKDRTDIFNLEQTEQRLETAKAFVSAVIASGRQVVFVGGKHEAIAIVKEMAEKTGSPYVAGRWIGGTLTNLDRKSVV